MSQKLKLEEAIKLTAEVLQSIQDSVRPVYEDSFLEAARVIESQSAGDFADLKRCLKSKKIPVTAWGATLKEHAEQKQFEEHQALIRAAEERARQQRESAGITDADLEAERRKEQQELAQLRMDLAIETSQRGTAEGIMNRYGDEFAYVVEAGQWAHYNGRIWEFKSTHLLHRLIGDLGKAYLEEAESARAKQPIKAEIYDKHAKKLLSREFCSGVESLAQVVEQATRLDAANFDNELCTGFINCANGTVDMRTGQLLPFDRAHYSSKLVDVEYDSEAECPTWEKALLKIFGSSQPLVDYFHQLVGYTMTGETREKAVVIGYGRTGNNGKSLILSVMEQIFGATNGGYTNRTPATTFMEKKNDQSVNNDIAALRGVRFVSTSETKKGRAFDVQLLKNISGNDPITARFLFQEFFTFRPHFTLWLMCNDLPEAPADDPAFWNRMHTLPFDVTFHLPGSAGYINLEANGESPEMEPLTGKHQYMADTNLESKLLAERQGILNWVVKGAMAYYAAGRLAKPDAVCAANQNYRDSMDSIDGFLNECCDIGETFRTAASAVNSAYVAYCRAAKHTPLKLDAFAKAMTQARGGGLFEKKRASNGNGLVWTGIRVYPDAMRNGHRQTEQSEPAELPEQGQDDMPF